MQAKKEPAQLGALPEAAPLLPRPTFSQDPAGAQQLSAVSQGPVARKEVCVEKDSAVSHKPEPLALAESTEAPSKAGDQDDFDLAVDEVLDSLRGISEDEGDGGKGTDCTGVESESVESFLEPPVLVKPDGFTETVVWSFLQQAWEKLSPEKRCRCHWNLTKGSHFTGDSADSLRPSLPTLATMCSGSGMAELAHRILTESLGAKEVLLHSCEKEKFKKRHLLEYVVPIMERPHFKDNDMLKKFGCLFPEFTCLAGTHTKCERHDKTCRVQEHPLVAIVGYSCKNLSKLNTPASVSRVLRNQVGSSGETCFALLQYLRNHRPVAA